MEDRVEKAPEGQRGRIGRLLHSQHSAGVDIPHPADWSTGGWVMFVVGCAIALPVAGCVLAIAYSSERKEEH